MTGRGGGLHGSKRSSGDRLDDVQTANREWWEQTPMTYDWGSSSGHPPASREWFAEEDRRSMAQHDHFLRGSTPFDRLLGGRSIEGMEVLEIGVGSGFHAELLVRAGARVTGIDLSAPAVDLTRKRFNLQELDGTFLTWDAEVENAEFRDRFDLIWSWGVVHHSAHTARIVRNVHDWLQPEGSFAGMVYHRDSSRILVALVRDWLLGWNWRRHSVDEALWRNTDGHSARFYPADQWRDLLLAFFDEADTEVQGLAVDAFPLPQPLRHALWRHVSASTRAALLGRLGHFLLFSAARPRG
jgi:2-polyprenyl-3-methyl-5-hydroxy-6-metoxy-1,4-benzoquinol methylase